MGAEQTAGADLFDAKSLSPMLIANDAAPFDSPDWQYELKLDGIRCLAYLDENGTELRSKRNLRLNATYPELGEIYKQAKKRGRCVLDGEITVFVDGKPNFEEVRRRAIMTDRFKIERLAIARPACFTAFDMLYVGDSSLLASPLVERVDMLFKSVDETPRLALSRHIDAEGTALFNAAKERGLEGIVAKRKTSIYIPGKRTKDWIKMKALLDEDFIVCGYFMKSNVASVIIGSVDGGCMSSNAGAIVYQGHVVLGVSRHDFRVMSNSMRTDKPACYPSFPDFDNAVWLVPELVCTVTFMERTKTGGLRQPVFKGLRDDKAAEDCYFRL